MYIPIPFISTLLSAIAFNLIIFDSTGSSLDNTEAASSTISFIKALGSFANKLFVKFKKNWMEDSSKYSSIGLNYNA